MSRRVQFSLRALLAAMLGLSVATMIIGREVAALRHSNVIDPIPVAVAWMIAGVSVGFPIGNRSLVGFLSSVFWSFASLIFFFAFTYIAMFALSSWLR